MELIDQLTNLASRVQKQVGHIQTEEATKNALVLPFINALGYNVFDPTEVVPEFVCDIGTKKGEKVDYAIFRDGKPIMLIECKHVGADLNINHAGQLFRYFHVTEARIAILTNGVTYKLFTDLEQPNKMDERPFLEFDLFNFHENDVTELRKLSKATFSIDDMLFAAYNLKYMRAFKKYFEEQFHQPSNDFIHFVSKQIYDGVLTPKLKEQFSALVHRSFQQFLNDKINLRLRAALVEPNSTTILTSEYVAAKPEETAVVAEPDGKDKDIVTTVEETEGFMIVRAILRKMVPVSRVVMRDVQSYCGILLDDNNRKPICRLHFNGSKKFVTLFDQEGGERVDIDSLDDLYGLASRIRAAVERHETRIKEAPLA
ncbi:type I restriction enzyme HsdR N-terminal domain-containing protein [Hymenobacter sp. 15J16-1T3B]|uniref:type I restriction endonuclease n=1 Tax=Hymenobacter sp. 15J16-1T3B TaxID=2886941 RepID=UPI001D12054C|nr:type I restriction endonuclease [Hymenobacter sp. 15J16-1T3B]MCC3158971.1 type I restriction enzyme HsdR N-terminal domain-containing protein [Hymenobacter sp. 15J16-1T3B]